MISTLPFPPIAFASACSREPPALYVVARHVRHNLAAVRADVSREHGNSRLRRTVEGGDDGRRVARRRENRGHVSGDEIFDLRGLLGRIHLARDDAYIEALRGGLLAQAGLEVLIEGVPLGQEGDADDAAWPPPPQAADRRRTAIRAHDARDTGLRRAPRPPSLPAAIRRTLR